MSLKHRFTFPAIVLTTCAMTGSHLCAGDSWAEFADETSSRLMAASNLVAGDNEEKDYTWGDVDQDGDIDLIIVRKQPFSTPGRRRNVLLMNEGIAEGHSLDGVLVDRTVEFMSAADDGGQGFLDETNDRDVRVVDVDQDGWLDVVTSTAYGQGLPKTISHSRIYMNLGETGGQWQGFEYQQQRIPQLSEAPNTCAVATGDVTGDGFPDLYYVTYNSSGLEDHLLVNDGTGNFTDQSNLVSSGFRNSGFGSAGEIADMNNDGLNDIIKSENGPVKIAYNSGGILNQWETASSGAHYHMSLGELNNDGQLDLIISDDGADRYRLNQGPGSNGMANFASSTFSLPDSFDDGFASNSVTADLNNDDFNDVLIADVDVDIGGCGRRTHIYRNLGNLPNPTLQEQVSGGEVVGIPTNMLSGTHDIAVFDLNGDGYQDIILGRCNSTEIWINQPPIGLVFTYPQGLPAFVEPNQPTEFQIELTAFGGGEPVPGSGTLFLSTDAGETFEPADLEQDGENLYNATLPAMACTETVSFYVSAELDIGTTFTDPPNAPASSYTVVAAVGTDVTIRDDIEGDVSDWEIINGPDLTSGGWEQAEPVGSITEDGEEAAPDHDAGANEDLLAFVTENGEPGGSASAADVDGGPTHLISPAIDLAGTDAAITYTRWFYSDGADGSEDDLMEIAITNDGETWVTVDEVGSTSAAWEVTSFTVSDFVEPTATIQVRFTATDLPNDSVTEAGIDNFTVEQLLCGDNCPSDINGDGATDGADLGALLGGWSSDDAQLDLDGDGAVTGSDLGILLGAWGECP